ncbi:hypothetical protein EON65_21695 [archaeon]|nr:MAG: hypothetical protein EON65_21695 [archaeon]
MDGALLSIRSGSWRSRSVMCTFLEHGVLLPNREDSIKQTFCEKTASGSIVGKNYSKGVVISHLSGCEGKSCSCLSFAADYLFGDVSSDGDVIDSAFWNATCERLVNNEMSYPFVAVFFYKQQVVLLSHLCHDETFCQELDAGTYILR